MALLSTLVPLWVAISPAPSVSSEVEPNALEAIALAYMNGLQRGDDRSPPDASLPETIEGLCGPADVLSRPEVSVVPRATMLDPVSDPTEAHVTIQVLVPNELTCLARVNLGREPGGWKVSGHAITGDA
jgi:hypothetical protein